MPEQHIITRWLLRAFAARVRGEWVLQVYDKALDTYEEVSQDEFLAETDAHSVTIERGLERIEGPAAAAALRLWKRTKHLPVGIYAVEGDMDEQVTGPAIADVGVVSGMRLLVSMHQIAAPTASDRLALARFVGLMYRRAPALEAMSVTFGEVYQDAAQAVLDRMLPGIRSHLDESREARRARMIANAETIATRLVSTNWWVARSGPRQAFVISDQPVGTTLTLGQVDDTWRAILAPDTYLIVLPINPGLALLIAPKAIILTAGIESVEQVAPAVNRLTWRSANRYVVARHRADLEAAIGDDLPDRTSIPIAFDWDVIANHATRDATQIVGEVQARRARVVWPAWWWDACRLRFEVLGSNGEDREYLEAFEARARRSGPRRRGPP